MSCLIEATAKSYRRICCCNPLLQECPTSLYTNGIACATGQINSIEMWTKDGYRGMSRANIESTSEYCYAQYKFKPLYDLQNNIEILMGNAAGCTYAEGIESKRFCKRKTTTCPSSLSYPLEDEMVIKCCCSGKDLCNHDSEFYNALSTFSQQRMTAECFGEAQYLKTFVPEFFIDITEETGPLCAVYHDLGKRLSASLRLYDNMVLSDPNDKNDWSQPCDAQMDKATARLENMLSTLHEAAARDSPTQTSPIIRPLPPCYYTKTPLTIKAWKYWKDEYHGSIKRKNSTETYWCYDSFVVIGDGMTLLSGEVFGNGSKMRTICATFVKKVKGVHCDLFDSLHVCCCKNKRESKEPCNGSRSFADYTDSVLYKLFGVPAKKILPDNVVNDTTNPL
uniref:Uncharacterized protein n=1 Tax=Parascaris univalens TaxID=6257 RepID=A0A915A690_PARUN